MAINWTEARIEEVVAEVIKSLGGAPEKKVGWDSTQYNGRKFIGVFADMNDAIDAATAGYKVIRAMSLEEREKVISAIRELCRKEASVMAELGVAETKMGRVEHKTAKHILVADKTPGTADIVAQVKTGDYGLTLTEMAPFGVVGSITPSTNPSETVLCNSIGMIAAGNGVVFNPHPNAIATSNYAVDLVNRACASAGGPQVLVASVVKPTLDTAQIMYKHPAIRLLVCMCAVWRQPCSAFTARSIASSMSLTRTIGRMGIISSFCTNGCSNAVSQMIHLISGPTFTPIFFSNTAASRPTHSRLTTFLTMPVLGFFASTKTISANLSACSKVIW